MRSNDNVKFPLERIKYYVMFCYVKAEIRVEEEGEKAECCRENYGMKYS